MDLEHQRCYIYAPPENDERPAKRQRISKPDVKGSQAKRLETYREVWGQQEQRIQVSLNVKSHLPILTRADNA